MQEVRCGAHKHCQNRFYRKGVVKPNLRPVFYYADSAEANYLLRRHQFEYSPNDLTIAKVLMRNKFANQRAVLERTRRKDELTVAAMNLCREALGEAETISDYNQLMGLEGKVAKSFFSAYFQHLNWQGRKPRMKCDPLNVSLDMGYTILFNFMECFIRMFGFDLYVGVYHRLWFKRKSLVCDLMEPFRSIIDHATALAFNRKQFSTSHFELSKQEYRLKHEYTATYYKVYCDALIARKTEIFRYVQQYYRCFMGRKSVSNYPSFDF